MNAFVSSISGLFIYLALLKILKFSQVSLITTNRESSATIILPAICASLCLNFSNTLWSQAVIAEVYPLNTFFISVLIYLLVQWYETSKSNILYLISFIYGISLGNHNTMMLLGPIIVVWVIWCNPQILKERKKIVLISVLFLLGLTVYLYLPIMPILARFFELLESRKRRHPTLPDMRECSTSYC